MELPTVDSGLKKFRGKWTKEEVKHLLKRTMFGAAKPDIDYFVSKSLRSSIKELLDTADAVPQPPVNN